MAASLHSGRSDLIGGLLGRRSKKPGARAKSARLRPFESLENRLLLAIFVPSQDNTLYQDAAGAVSNGFGANLVAGTINRATDNLRRALVRFDVSPLLPGSIVTDARLDLTVTRDPSGTTPSHDFSVHRVSQAWGESGSLVLGAGGRGVPAVVNDATWLHTSFSTATWTTPGGDFEPTASATTSVGDSGTVASWTSQTLAADVQSWINDPETNFGWILLGEEGNLKSARRFSSRHGIATPVLEVTVTAPGPTVSLSVNRVLIEEEGGGEATFTATMSSSVQDDVIIELDFSGTATLGTDYTTTSTRIVIPAGGSEGAVTITTVDDILGEGDETVIVDIASVSGANEAGTQRAIVTITDGEGGPVVPAVSLEVDSAAILETGGVATFSAILSAATTVPVTVDLDFSGSATMTTDYTTSGTQIVVAAGATTGSITVAAVQDELDEADETVIVNIALVTGGTESGTQQQTTTITDDDDLLSFSVSSLAPTSSGFTAELNADVDVSVLNLYGAGLGDPDALLSGATSGPVAGSLVVDPTLRMVTFIKTGDPLPADTYTVRLRSADDGFKDLAGNLLDGDGDNVGGDDFVDSFTVAPLAAGSVALALPDFVRGAGQDIHLPADTTGGIPVSISISEGTTVRSVDLRISYDPALLDITAATVGAEMPAGAFVVLIDDTPGLAILAVRTTTGMPVGTNVLLNVQANVPTADASENYGTQQVLDVHSVTISDGLDTEFPVVDDDAMHLVSYFADVTGNGRINAGDASQVARFAALLETGFDAGSQLADPFIVGDMSGNGRLNAGDASLLAQFAALFEVPEIPPLPGGIRITGGPASTPREHQAPLLASLAVETRIIVGGAPAVLKGAAITGSSATTTFNVVQTFASEDVGTGDIDAFAVDAAIVDLTDSMNQESDGEELIVRTLAEQCELSCSSTERGLH